MKKVVVFTDLSQRAAHAASYAFCLASSLQADVLLYHCVTAGVAEVLAPQISWSEYAYDEIRKSSVIKLENLGVQIRELSDQLPYTAYFPKVSTLCVDGVFNRNMTDIDQDDDIILAVAATHTSGIGAVVNGDHVREMIENLAIPLLIVPQGAEFKPYRQILFLSTLCDEDIPVIHTLLSIAVPLKAGITVLHINPDKKNAAIDCESFEKKIDQMINYSKIWVVDFNAEKIQDTITEVSRVFPHDLLVMAHRSETVLHRLFGRSDTKRVSKDAKEPLLIIQQPQH